MIGQILAQIAVGILGLIVVVATIRSVRIVPAKKVLVVERLGKYSGTLEAGFHLLIPFIDKVAYEHSPKEQAIDVPSQPCFTWDNVKVDVDGVLYFRVVDPVKASYGITDYQVGTIQLAQTTMRSVIGKLELDKTFEERDAINATIVQAVDEAGEQWGVDVTRYEIQNINVPNDILTAMEAQLRAEREKRAQIARSLAQMESSINESSGEMEQVINRSEGEKERRINEAEGRAAEIRALAGATATSLRRIAEALDVDGGDEAISLQLSEQYVHQLRGLADARTDIILPLNLADIDGVLDSVREILQRAGTRAPG